MLRNLGNTPRRDRPQRHDTLSPSATRSSASRAAAASFRPSAPLPSSDRERRPLPTLYGCYTVNRTLSGEGVYAVYLAEQGFSVVGIDFVPAALDAAKARAERAHVDVELDSGCLHHLPKAKINRYRTRLDEWLAPGGDYILVHLAHRPRALWIPKGPRHMKRAEAVEFFAPLQLQAYEETYFDVPFPMGRMRAGVYWFSRPAN